jgi:5-methylcytosine-specific restriction endonuclease McrA
MEHRTARGGWTIAQCHALGAGWPPSKGWIDRAIVTDFTQEQLASFIKFKSRTETKKARAEQRAIRRAAKGTGKSLPCKTVFRQEAKTPARKGMFRIDPNSPEFLASYEWRTLRMEVLTKYGPRCMCCGATPDDGLRMHVDHIKPRKKYPGLALIFDNLQVLCEVCNHGKSNWDETDWRPVRDEAAEEAAALIRSIAKG